MKWKMRVWIAFGRHSRQNSRPPPPQKKTTKTKKTKKQKQNKTKQKTKNKEMWCSFCNGPHPSSILAVVTETEARKRVLRLEKRRCFGCLRSGHVSRDCQAK